MAWIVDRSCLLDYMLTVVEVSALDQGLLAHFLALYSTYHTYIIHHASIPA